MAINGKKIRQIRMQRGITKRQLSEWSGISINTIKSWEKKEVLTACNLEQILQVVKILDCSLQDIVEDGQNLRLRSRRIHTEDGRSLDEQHTHD